MFFLIRFSFFVLQDIDFFQHLEMHMRSELPNLVGRDHMSFRSYYIPVKVCVAVGAISIVSSVMED